MYPFTIQVILLSGPMAAEAVPLSGARLRVRELLLCYPKIGANASFVDAYVP